MDLQKVIELIPADLWQKMVYQTYINSLLSWIGLAIVLLYILAFYACWKYSDDWEGDKWPIAVVLIGGLCAFFGFLVWMASGFNFLNPEYHTYAKLLSKLSNIF